MNLEMTYLLGMICGNGEIKRGPTETTISIEIPHKKLETENGENVKIYIKASITDIRNVIEPLITTGLNFLQQNKSSIISFTKPNSDYLIREINRYTGAAISHEDMRINTEVFNFSKEEKISFLQGFADVTGYIRRSNYFMEKHNHRVYIEIPRNWYMVVDICNLLKSVDVPVQVIDWAHPNMRDSKMKKYNEGKTTFWKKEHQIKIWANEFVPIGFAVLHKKEALIKFSNELTSAYQKQGKDAEETTHKFYWQTRRKSNKSKCKHPAETDEFIPEELRGKHFDSWTMIANELGYNEVS